MLYYSIILSIVAYLLIATDCRTMHQSYPLFKFMVHITVIQTRPNLNIVKTPLSYLANVDVDRVLLLMCTYRPIIEIQVLSCLWILMKTCRFRLPVIRASLLHKNIGQDEKLKHEIIHNMATLSAKLRCSKVSVHVGHII